VRRLLFAFVAVVMPLAAQAECLGQGCYSGLGILLGMAVAFVIGVVILVVLMFMRRWRAAQVLGAVLGCVMIVAVYLMY
jgi:hypothetical protein